MSVLPELRAQVVAAAAAPARRRPRAEWVVGATVALVAAAVGFLALRHDAPRPAPAGSGGRAQQLRLFGILRRAPTAADRAAIAHVDRQRLSTPPRDVRDVGVRSHGRPVILYSVRVQRPPPQLPARQRLRLTQHNLLCVQVPDVHGAGVGCWSTAEILRHTATASLGPRVFGPVPDGVASVRVTYRDGTVRTARVHDNFFMFVEPHVTHLPGGTAYSPDPQVRLEWLDARGRPVRR